MNCPRCGAAVEEPGARFCEMCGAALEQPSAVSPQPSARSPEAQVPSPERAPGAAAPEAEPVAEPAEAEREEAVPQPGAAAPQAEPAEGDGPSEDLRDRREQLRPYLEALATAWADGTLTPTDVKTLADLREQYGVTPEEHAALEREVTRHVGEGEPISVEAPAPEDVESGELRLERNESAFLMVDHGGVIHLRLTNITTEPLTDVRLTLRSKLLSEPLTYNVPQFQPRQRIDRMTEIEPDMGGVRLVNIEVQYAVGDEPKAFTAQTGLMVLDQFKTPKQLLIDMRGMVQVTAEKIYGQSIHADLERMVQQGVIKTPNDLMTREFPDHFQPIGLEFDYEATERLRARKKVRRSKRKATGLGEHPAALTRASLFWEAEGRPCNVVLLAQPSVAMGRNRSNDVTLRVLPRSDLTDPRSLEISDRGHLEIALRADGVAVLDDSKNGTFLDNQPVVVEELIPPGSYRTSRLEVGCAVLRLRMDFYRRNVEADPDDQYEALMRGPVPEAWGLAGQAGLRALRLKRVNNLGRGDPNGEEQYVLVYRWVQVGSSVGNAIVIPRGGLDEIHARLLHFDGGFWLEPLSHSEPTKVNGVMLERDTLTPLSPGMRLTFGTAEVEFSDHCQLHVT